MGSVVAISLRSAQPTRLPRRVLCRVLPPLKSSVKLPFPPCGYLTPNSTPSMLHQASSPLTTTKCTTSCRSSPKPTQPATSSSPPLISLGYRDFGHPAPSKSLCATGSHHASCYSSATALPPTSGSSAVSLAQAHLSSNPGATSLSRRTRRRAYPWMRTLTRPC